jgi:hypothetical protein
MPLVKESVKDCAWVGEYALVQFLIAKNKACNLDRLFCSCFVPKLDIPFFGAQDCFRLLAIMLLTRSLQLG